MFHTIQPSPGLEPSQRRRANQYGPPATSLRTSYPSMLRSAGFVDIQVQDDTEEYGATQQRWIAASGRYEGALRDAFGDAEYEERMRNRQATFGAIEAGLLARFRYAATR